MAKVEHVYGGARQISLRKLMGDLLVQRLLSQGLHFSAKEEGHSLILVQDNPSGDTVLKVEIKVPSPNLGRGPISWNHATCLITMEGTPSRSPMAHFNLSSLRRALSPLFPDVWHYSSAEMGDLFSRGITQPQINAINELAESRQARGKVLRGEGEEVVIQYPDKKYKISPKGEIQ